MTSEDRQAAYARVRRELGVGRMGTGPDAPPLPPRQGGAGPASVLPIEREILGVQMYEYGVIWARPGLSLRMRSFVTLGVLTALGYSDQLYDHINNALNLDATPEEVHEALLHTSVYAGMAPWTNAYGVAREVFLARGILTAGPSQGARSEPVPSAMTDESRRAARDRLTKAFGLYRVGHGPDSRPLVPLPGPAAVTATSPYPLEAELARVQADYGLSEVWAREGLDLRTRSMITLGLLQVLHETDHLHLHVNNALNLGVTPDEIHEVFAQAGLYGGVSGWNSARFIARDVFMQHGILEGPR